MQHKTKSFMGALAYGFMALSMCLVLSCSDENMDENPQLKSETIEEPEDEIRLRPKVLATIRLSNGIIGTFRSDEDGVVYEEEGSIHTTVESRDMSVLQRFMTLTSDKVAVPEDLLIVEDDERTRELARGRGVVIQHTDVIDQFTSGTTTVQLASSSWCSGSPTFYDTDAYGQFYRTFKNHTWGIAGCTVYSSWKSGADKCKTVQLYLVNCSSSNKLSADTWYKNVWGNYKKQDVINVNPSASRFWSKTYTSKRNRRAFVSGFGSGVFGGYVLFKKY